MNLSTRDKITVILGMIVLPILILVLCCYVVPQSCQCGTTTRIQRDTVRIAADTVVIEREHIVPKYVFRDGREIHDTTIQEVIRWREVQRAHLDSLGVAELMTLDTSTALPFFVNGSRSVIPIDLRTTADCIHRSIRQEILMRDTTMIYAREVQVPKEKTIALGIGVSYGVSAEGKLVPTLAISISRILFSF